MCVTIHLFVKDVDKMLHQALAAGVMAMMPIHDESLGGGERYANVTELSATHLLQLSYQR